VPPSSVAESGAVFKTQPVVRVLSASGEPVSGVMVHAVASMARAKQLGFHGGGGYQSIPPNSTWDFALRAMRLCFLVGDTSVPTSEDGYAFFKVCWLVAGYEGRCAASPLEFFE
jgi:hypothetical protein